MEKTKNQEVRKVFKDIAESVQKEYLKLVEKGWRTDDLEEKGNQTSVVMFKRIRKLQNLFSQNIRMKSKKCDSLTKNENISQKLSRSQTEDPSVKPMVSSTSQGMVSNPPMGNPKQDLTPVTKRRWSMLTDVYKRSEYLPTLSRIKDYQYSSVSLLNDSDDALVISYNSEWYFPSCDNDGHTNYETGSRELLTCQFSLVYQDELREYVFLRKDTVESLSLELVMGRILDDLDLPSTDVRKVRKYCSLTKPNKGNGVIKEISYDSKKDADSFSVKSYPDGKKVHSYYAWNDVPKIPIVLLCFSGTADISAFDQRGHNCMDILKNCTDVRGGLVSFHSVNIYPCSLKSKFVRNNNTHKYAVSIQIADTLCHAPGKKQKVEDIGRAISWEKIELSSDIKEHMDKLLQNDPCLFFEYASNDSVIALLYVASLYGYNKRPPVTLNSASSKVMCKIMKRCLGCETTEDFDRTYRGLHKINHGDVPNKIKSAFIENSSLEPISDDAHQIQYFASKAYHGGYNVSSEVGCFPGTTMDYDLKNAYPTAMCLVPDVNWDKPIQTEITQKELTLDYFEKQFSGCSPLTMMVAYITFEFPKNVKYPCISVDVDGVPVYPRTSDGCDGVYVCGPEIYLALKLGARIYCKRGYVINNRSVDEKGHSGYSLQVAVKQLVKDREKAKQDCGKGSIEELMLKEMANAGYGKVAQNVIQKHTWSAFKNDMDNLGCSAITNPVSACMITSIIRAVLIATQNQCHELGYITLSVTTDGFIGNIPEDELKRLDLYGFRTFLEQSRNYLTDDQNSDIWEMKHAQDDLLNFTTRGNVSLYTEENPYILEGKEYVGVCAHAGLQSRHMHDSYEDRLWLMKMIAGRIGKVTYTETAWTSFKELVKGKEFRKEMFRVGLSMDFDMKRKPDKDSFEKRLISVEGEEYEIATFSTVPFENVAEFSEYRAAKEKCKCLRTMSDWDIFWFKSDIRQTNSKIKIRNREWTILFNCVVGHRAGLWNIPMLDKLKGDARCEWLNRFNTSGKTFTETDWKNAGRKDRQKNILQRGMLEEKLSELISG